MTLAVKALKYAQTHLQAVRIVWLDRESETYDAIEAVALCSDPRRSGLIVGAVAQDKRLETMLNELIDGA